MLRGFLPLGVVLCSLSVGAADFPEIDSQVRAGLNRVMRENWWPGTSLVYSCRPDEVEPASSYTNGFKVWEKDGDYGKGLEDCAILGGVLLSGVCDEYAVTGRAELRDVAGKLAQGLINLATVHGVRGFVARGICVEDGKSVCALSSIDQHTHAVHGLWRYWSSPLCEDRLRPEIRRVLAEIADRMTEQVVESNDWSFQQAVGKGTTRGICKMRFNHPHEGLRLTMIYAAAWAVTGEERFKTKMDEFIGEGLAKTREFTTANETELLEIVRRMPDYSFLQMQTSVELVREIVSGETLKAELAQVMRRPAEVAADRARRLGVADTRYLCGCGELALAQLMTPDFAYGDDQRQTLVRAIQSQSLADKASSTRVVHLYAAWWRFRRVSGNAMLYARRAERPQYRCYRSFKKQPEQTAAFGKMGVNTRCFFAANTINHGGSPPRGRGESHGQAGGRTACDGRLFGRFHYGDVRLAKHDDGLDA